MKTKILLVVCLVCVLLLPSLSVRADALPEQEPTPTDTKISPPAQSDPNIQTDPLVQDEPGDTFPISILLTIGLGVLVLIVVVVSAFVIAEIKKNTHKPGE
jgi:ABC-type glycerol-3-phosphate transport system permease component